MRMERMKNPKFRWHTLEETYDALLPGWEGSVENLLKKAAAASPINYINEKMCPILYYARGSRQFCPRGGA